MIEDIKVNGIRIYHFCAKIKTEIESIINTFILFFGGLGTSESYISYFKNPHIPEYMEFANIEFIRDVMDWDIERREIEEVRLAEDYIQTGDVFLVLRLDGVDPIIMYGTGTHVGHSAMAMRFEDDGDLYIVES